jgi:hypothetical protein
MSWFNSFYTYKNVYVTCLVLNVLDGRLGHIACEKRVMWTSTNLKQHCSNGQTHHKFASTLISVM